MLVLLHEYVFLLLGVPLVFELEDAVRHEVEDVLVRHARLVQTLDHIYVSRAYIRSIRASRILAVECLII
jgi:hypothetical protein